MQPSLVGAQDSGGLLANLILQAASGDDLALAAVNALFSLSALVLFDGTNYDRARSASAANLAGLTANGAQLVAQPGDWSVAHTPAAATQATATKAAAGAGIRHVCTSISAVVTTGATAQTAIQVSLRDGATGAGTILWSQTIALPANAIAVIALSGLNIIGTVNTAMTLEFSAAGVAASTESVSITGHEAN